MYSVIEIAKFIISYCTKMDTPISNLQLQKILYYLQVYYVRNGRYPLFKEDIYAWQHGPVIPEVYYMFSGYGATRIRNLYVTQIEQAVQANILPIIERLRRLEPWYLVNMTHESGKPWDMVYNQGVDPNGLIDKRLLAMDRTDLGVNDERVYQ